jgi:hypothetical protein
MLPAFSIKKTPKVREHKPLEARLGRFEKRVAMGVAALQVLGLAFTAWMIAGNYHGWWLEKTTVPANTTVTIDPISAIILQDLTATLGEQTETLRKLVETLEKNSVIPEPDMTTSSHDSTFLDHSRILKVTQEHMSDL